MKTTKKFSGFLAILCMLFILGANNAKAQPCATVVNNLDCSIEVEVRIFGPSTNCPLCGTVITTTIHAAGGTYNINCPGVCLPVCDIQVTLVKVGPVSTNVSVDWTNTQVDVPAVSCASTGVHTLSYASGVFTVQ